MDDTLGLQFKETENMFESAIEKAKSIKIEASLSEDSLKQFDKNIQILIDMPTQISKKVCESMSNCYNEVSVVLMNDAKEFFDNLTEKQNEHFENLLEKQKEYFIISHKTGYIYLSVLIGMNCLALYFYIQYKSAIEQIEECKMVLNSIFGVGLILLGLWVLAKIWNLFCSGWNKITKKH